MADTSRWTPTTNVQKTAVLANKENDISALNAKTVKKNIMYAAIPEAEKWRIGVIQDLMNVEDSTAYLDLSHQETSDLMQFACTS